MIGQSKNNTKPNLNLIRIKSLLKVIVSNSYGIPLSYFLTLYIPSVERSQREKRDHIDLKDQEPQKFWDL